MKRAEQTLLFLILLFLPTQLGKHFWPSFSFIYSLPIDYLSPVIYFWDLLVLLLFCLFLLRRPYINKVALNLVFFFILTQTFSLFGSVNLGAGLVRLEQYIICGLFGIYLASLKFKVQSIKLFWPLIISVLLESLLAIGQFMKEGTVGLWILGERSFTLSTPGIAKFDYHGLEFLRPYATFPHPNVLAGFMIVTIIVILSVTKDIFLATFRATILKVATVLAGVTILLTVSRVALVAGLGSALLTFKKKGRILLLLLVLLLLPILFTRFSSLFNFDILSLVRREEQVVIAFNLWLSHPLIGVGLNNFIIAASDQLLSGPTRFLQPVHNIFLLALSETGVVGLLGLLFFIGLPMYKLFRLRTNNYQLQTLLLVWFVILFLGMFDHYFLTLPQGYRLLFLVWGISMSVLELKA